MTITANTSVLASHWECLNVVAQSAKSSSRQIFLTIAKDDPALISSVWENDRTGTDGMPFIVGLLDQFGDKQYHFRYMSYNIINCSTMLILPLIPSLH